MLICVDQNISARIITRQIRQILIDAGIDVDKEVERELLEIMQKA